MVTRTADKRAATGWHRRGTLPGHAARLLVLLAALLCLGAPAADAQYVRPPGDEPVTAEQGRQTLADIIARQKGEAGERPHRDWDTAQGNAAGIGATLGTRGGPSDAEVWEALRFGTAEVNVSAGGEPARVVIQDGGMWWLEFREGPLRTYGGYLLLGTIALLAIFFAIRGRIRIAKGKSGETIQRFDGLERFSHWLIAGSFVLLAFTGLIELFGRGGLMELTGKEGYATLARVSKVIHTNVAWAFIIGLVMIFVLWVHHNLPAREDLNWILKGGGIVGKHHPPAKKFNAGQKLIFWSVILFGGSIAVSGVSLLFPYELPMFAKTFEILNNIGVPELLDMQPFPAQLAVQEEMQFAQLWHAIVGFVLMAIIIAHIYIGSIGMEGAFAAMGSGQVDVNWATDHHSLWVEKLREDEKTRAAATPAE